jgi:hypothetical protein
MSEHSREFDTEHYIEIISHAMFVLFGHDKSQTAEWFISSVPFIDLPQGIDFIYHEEPGYYIARLMLKMIQGHNERTPEENEQRRLYQHRLAGCLAGLYYPECLNPGFDWSVIRQCLQSILNELNITLPSLPHVSPDSGSE